MWHGCNRCYKKRDRRILGGQTIEDRYQATLDKKHRIQQLGYDYIELWQCELDDWMEESAELRDFFKKQTDVISPLNPRDAIAGGRTCPIAMRYTPKEGEELSYVDVCR